MKTIIFFVATLTLAFSSFAQADCATARHRLYDDVNSAIHTYPASCTGLVHLKCSFLFNSRLPALLKQLETDTPQARANLRRIAAGVNEKRAELASIIDAPYRGQMNGIINGINSYVRRCVR